MPSWGHAMDIFTDVCQYPLGSLDLGRNTETHAGAHVCFLTCPLRGLVWMKKPFRDSASGFTQGPAGGETEQLKVV